jgi:hypothetical protein
MTQRCRTGDTATHVARRARLFLGDCLEKSSQSSLAPPLTLIPCCSGAEPPGAHQMLAALVVSNTLADRQ